MARRAASTSAFAESTRSLYCMKLRPASVTLCNLYSSLRARAAASAFLPETGCGIGVSTGVAVLSVCTATTGGACRRVDLLASQNRPTTAQTTRAAARILYCECLCSSLGGAMAVWRASTLVRSWPHFLHASSPVKATKPQFGHFLLLTGGTPFQAGRESMRFGVGA